MHARRTFAIGMIVLLAACGLVAAAGGPSVAPYSATLADGAARPVAEQSCVACHSAMLITQQHKDSLGWEKSVRQMESWGAPVPKDQHRALVDYLLRNYGPIADPKGTARLRER